MKPVGELKILNHQPYIIMTHEDLCAIQHIVDIAPKEAQWFHRVERSIEKGVIMYNLYEMYIPEQYCSAAEVDTDPEMMMKFFQELSKEHGPETANDIVQNMTAWCHSHHTMGVNPSGQDQKQFKEQCELAAKQGINLPQVMLIFNKRNEYYCRLWDPEANLMLENVDIIIGNYDFDWIDEQAKTKFKKKVVKTVPSTQGRKHWQGGGLIDFNQLGWSGSPSASRTGGKKKTRKERNEKNVKPKPKLTNELGGIELVEEEIQELIESTAKVDDYNNVDKLLEILDNTLNEVQLCYLSILSSGNETEIWELENEIIISNEDLYEEAKLELHNNIIEFAGESEEFVQMIRCAIMLEHAPNAEVAEQIIDHYMTFYFDDMWPNPYEEEEEAKRQHIRDILNER